MAGLAVLVTGAPAVSAGPPPPACPRSAVRSPPSTWHPPPGQERHRPVLRQMQAEDLGQGCLRHRRRGAALADQRRTRRRHHRTI